MEIFKPSMHDSALQRLNLEAEMRQGLDRGEFEPFLQPILSLSDGTIHSRRRRAGATPAAASSPPVSFSTKPRRPV